jgi:hypothetical protein
MKNKILAFADEFGNNSFDFSTQSTHFIIGTVIINNDKLTELESSVEAIKKKFNFQKGELKSSSVSNNYGRRSNILREIVKLDLSFFAVVVDKRELFGKGFEYKRVFYKYLNNLLYKELFRTFPNVSLTVDEHGGNDFMLDFKKYVIRSQPPNLFSGSDFEFGNSAESNMLQVADFFAGTLGYIYDEHKKSEHSNEFLQILTPKISAINIFPQRFNFHEWQESNIDPQFDKVVAELSLTRINNYLETNSDKSGEEDRVTFLNLMLLLLRANSRNRYYTAKEILGHLNANRRDKIGNEEFRSKIVGNLRDSGVLIASSRDGYKIPTNARDLQKFVNHGKRVILPMINRINEARKALKIASKNEIDILSSPEYSELVKLLEALE